MKVIMDFEKESSVLKALGHPVRLKIVQSLLENECCVNKIADTFELPQSTISQHLAVLKNSGIIYPSKKGVKTCYKVCDDRVIKILDILRN